jgi:hypothetical protein
MFLYDKDTGIFTRRHFGKRSKLAGRVGNIKTNGYLEVGIGGKKYLLHRLAWLYTYGLWPLFHIDHINGIKTDNRIANLRDVTHTVNMQNRSGGEKIGYVGRFRDRWRAQLQRNKKKATKTFKTEQECHSWLASLSAAM